MTSTALDALTDSIAARRALPPPASRRALRLAAGATLEQTGRAANVTAKAVRLWETGQRSPHGQRLLDYLAILEVFKESLG